MKEVLNKLLEKMISEKKGFKVISWIIIILFILIVVLYPIIDANFLYYNRTIKRIEIIQKLISIDKDDINKDSRLEEEYNSILDEMNNQKYNYINNIFQQETNTGMNIAKFIAGSWLFILLGIIMIFSKDKISKKRFIKNNIQGGLICIIIAVFFGYVAKKIPNIINPGINIILYQIILIFLAYTIVTSTKKEK